MPSRCLGRSRRPHPGRVRWRSSGEGRGRAAFGAMVGSIVGLLLKTGAVAVLLAAGDTLVVVAAALALGGVSPLVLAWALPYARSGEGSGRILTDQHVPLEPWAAASAGWRLCSRPRSSVSGPCRCWPAQGRPRLLVAVIASRRLGGMTGRRFTRGGHRVDGDNGKPAARGGGDGLMLRSNLRRIGATRLLLIRHLEPDQSVPGQAYGSLDAPLRISPSGKATKLAQALEGVASRRGVYKTGFAVRSRRQPLLAVQPQTRPGRTRKAYGRSTSAKSGEPVRRDRGRTGPGLFRSWMSDHRRDRFRAENRSPSCVFACSARLRRSARAMRGERFASARARRSGARDRRRSLGMPDEALFRLDQAYGAVGVIDWYGRSPILRLLNASVMLAVRRA